MNPQKLPEILPPVIFDTFELLDELLDACIAAVRRPVHQNIARFTSAQPVA